jgi:coenzyme PQQ biosynthesis protein PqqD
MPFDDQSRPSLARGVRLQTDATTGEPILLFPEGVLHLSATAHDILIRCTGERNVAEIISDLAGDYDVDRDTLRKDVLDCLLDLYERKLVVF